MKALNPKGGDEKCVAPVIPSADLTVLSIPVSATSPASEVTNEARSFNWDNLEGAEQALSDIYVLCGNSDPSDGEGTGYDEVVQAVDIKIKELSTVRAELARVQEDDWTSSLIDRVNEILREHHITDQVNNGEQCSRAIQAIHGQLGSQSAQITKLREALRKYGRHNDPVCNSKQCFCGLKEAMV